MGDVLAGAVVALRAAGARVVDVSADLSPTFAETDRLAQALMQATVSAFLPPPEFSRILAVAEDGSAPERARRWARQVTARSHDTGRATTRRADLAAHWAGLFRDVDVVLMPVTPTTAPVHDPARMDDRQLIVNGAPAGYGDQFAWMQTVEPCTCRGRHRPAGTGPGRPPGRRAGRRSPPRRPHDLARRRARR